MSLTSVNNGNIGTKFTIGKKLGAGGFGSVYACEDEYGNQFAVKCIETEDSGIPHPLELSVMASIRHPYLNSAHKIYVKDDMVYIFMDLAKSDLSKIVRRDKNPNYVPDPVKIRKWICSLVLAIACLHNQRIIHADIKASNILIFGNDDHAKLSDFSLVMKFWKSDTKFNHTIGTSTHRPMENLLQKDWDLSLDIWSLGVTIYEILYGTLIFPYQGDLGRVKKDHITERCINCLIDWAERGPRKQSCDAIPFKHKFHVFNLVPEFWNDPYNLNDLLLKMLSVNPKDRPTINQILTHPYFQGYQRPLCTLIGTPTSKVKRPRLEKILNICTTNGLGSSVVSLSIELYSRTMHIQAKRNSEKEIRLLTCIWLACKITKKRVPNFTFDKYPLKRILEMEKTICNTLEFKLHHASNSHKK